jgi:hypothetical protein
MTDILYYSNYCTHSKKIIQDLAKTQIKDKIHFICIDNRVKEEDKTYVVLQNGKKIIMPDNIVKVPAMMNLSNYKIIYGEEIYAYLKPRSVKETSLATMNNMEPMAFSFGEGTAGVASDNFSFLDMTSDSLAATGDGGLRQMYNYVSVDYQNAAINTPTEDFGSRKNMTMEQLQKQRDMDVKRNI